MINVSCVVPARDEEASLREVHRRFVATMDERGWSHELIVVDDGSTDGTWRLVNDLAQTHGDVVGIRLVRGAGMLEAVAVGMASARGSVVCMLEADLESRPEDLPRLIERVLEGIELVAGFRTNQRARPGLRWAGSGALQAVMAHTRHAPDDLGCGVKAMSRTLVRRVIEDPASGTDLRFGYALLDQARSFDQCPIPWIEQNHQSHFTTLGLALNLATFSSLVFRRPIAIGARWAPLVAVVATGDLLRTQERKRRWSRVLPAAGCWGAALTLRWLISLSRPDGLPGSTAQVASVVGRQEIENQPSVRP